MENLQTITNWINSFEEELWNSMEYKIASDFNKDELEFDGTAESYEDLKDKAFYMACQLVHIHYELRKIEDFLNAVNKYQ